MTNGTYPWLFVTQTTHVSPKIDILLIPFMILYNNAAYAIMCQDSGWHFTRIWKTHGGIMSLRSESRPRTKDKSVPHQRMSHVFVYYATCSST